MIRHFPHEAALLSPTKLRYVDLGAVLSDGKVDRAARAPSFVPIFLGSRTGLIFLDDGEPAAAAWLGEGERGPTTVAEVLERAAAERERADVAFLRAPGEQLLAMWASVATEPLLRVPPRSYASEDELLASLAGARGVVEVLIGAAVHYVVLADGPAARFVARSPGTGGRGSHSAGEEAGHDPSGGLTAVLGDAVEAAIVSVFPPVAALPRQAAPALFTLYARTMERAFAALQASGPGHGTGEPVDHGADAAGYATTVLSAALERAIRRHPPLGAFVVGSGGVAIRPSIADDEELSAAVAAWLFEALTEHHRRGGPEPARVLDDIARDQRFALAAQSFFDRLPWPVTW